MRIIEKKKKKINEVESSLESKFNEIKDELEAKLKKLSGIQFKITVENSSAVDLLRFSDKKNVVSKIGAFGLVLKEIHIEGAFWQIQGCDIFAGYVDFRYESKSGRTNGLLILDFKYENGKLTFTDGARKAI
jgi:hypothetical protein